MSVNPSVALNGTAIACNSPGAHCSLGDSLRALSSNEALVGQIVHIRLADGTYSLDVSAVNGVQTFNSTLIVSSIRISGSGATVITSDSDGAANRASLLSVAPGATATFDNLQFRNSSALPLVVDGGSVFVINCTFAHNTKGAIIMNGGDLSIANTTFVGNLNDHGGALQQSGGTVAISLSNFTNNIATDAGGAIHVVTGNMTLTGAYLLNNVASRGGAIAANGGRLLITSSLLEGNVVTAIRSLPAANGGNATNVPAGRTIDNQGASITYALPLPAGYWTFNAIQCVWRASATGVRLPDNEQPCLSVLSQYPSLEGRTVVELNSRGLELGGLNEPSFPLRCAATLFGGSIEPEFQITPRCSGECPPGFQCGSGTQTPVGCPIGTYCPPGSSEATNCPPGTYGDIANASSVDQCKVCLPGHCEPPRNRATRFTPYSPTRTDHRACLESGFRIAQTAPLGPRSRRCWSN